jgi:hypothetical protein
MLIVRCLYLAGDGPRPVRAGSAWPLSSDRSVRRGSKVKRDFACTFTRHLLPVCVVLRSQSCLRLEGRTRTLSGPSPDLSPARTLALSSRCEGLLTHRLPMGIRSHSDQFVTSGAAQSIVRISPSTGQVVHPAGLVLRKEIIPIWAIVSAQLPSGSPYKLVI